MVDNLDEMIIETSDLSLFCFYSKLFEDNFQMCLEFPAQVCAECIECRVSLVPHHVSCQTGCTGVNVQHFIKMLTYRTDLSSHFLSYVDISPTLQPIFVPRRGFTLGRGVWGEVFNIVSSGATIVICPLQCDQHVSGRNGQGSEKYHYNSLRRAVHAVGQTSP